MRGGEAGGPVAGQRAGPAGTAQRSPFRRARAPPVASHAPPPPLRSSAILDGQAGGRAGVCVRCESRHECFKLCVRWRDVEAANLRASDGRACVHRAGTQAGACVCVRAARACVFPRGVKELDGL